MKNSETPGRWNIHPSAGAPDLRIFPCGTYYQMFHQIHGIAYYCPEKKRTEGNYHTPPPYSHLRTRPFNVCHQLAISGGFTAQQATLRMAAFDCFCAASTSVTAAPAAATAASAQAVSGAMPAAWCCVKDGGLGLLRDCYKWSTNRCLVPKVDALLF